MSLPDGSQFMYVEQESWQVTDEKHQDEAHKYDGHVVLLFAPVKIKGFITTA